MDEFGSLGIYLILAVVVPTSMLMIPLLLTMAKVKPHHPDAVKNSTYECGMRTVGGSWVRFNFRYYLFAISFLIFSVEAVFLFPWAVTIADLGAQAFWEMLVFIGILAFGLLYAWKVGVLHWR